MDEYRQRLGDALERAKQKSRSKHADVLHTSDLSRQDRELLISGGWLHEVTRGWYLLLRPDVTPGDSTAWYAHFWEFLRIYLEHHYHGDYCLSAESSLQLHLGETTVPNQVIAIVQKGGGKPKQLPHDTSVYVYADPKNLPPEEDQEKIYGLRCMSLPLALCRVAPRFFLDSPINAEIALSTMEQPLNLVHTAARYGMHQAAGRLIGGYVHIGRETIADSLRSAAKRYRLRFTETNPFSDQPPLSIPMLTPSPYGARVRALWAIHRNTVLQNFPEPPLKISNKESYLRNMEGVYVHDAYNSLSIEGYQVNPDLVERVRNELWNPKANSNDASERNALAARGYYEAFQAVKQSVSAVLDSSSPGKIVQANLHAWYTALFSPSIDAGLISSRDLAGYRRGPVYIRGSRHVPPPREALLDAMSAFFDCLQTEEHPAVRAILGHYIFVHIHPYPDGNGRTARFLMNTMLASGGYPWTVIRVARRNEYITALENTTINQDIGPFAKFVAEELQASVKLVQK